jgi:hypothetical protein
MIVWNTWLVLNTKDSSISALSWHVKMMQMYKSMFITKGSLKIRQTCISNNHFMLFTQIKERLKCKKKTLNPFSFI